MELNDCRSILTRKKTKGTAWRRFYILAGYYIFRSLLKLWYILEQNMMSHFDWQRYSRWSDLFIEKPSFRLIDPMAYVYIRDPISMKFYRHFIIVEKARCSRLDNNILTNNKNWTTVCMSASSYIVSTGSVRTQFHQYSFKIFCNRRADE